MKKLKVFGGNIFYGTPRKQVRALIAAYTKKEAVELVNTVSNISYSHFNDFFCETGNSIELSLATEVGLYIEEEEFKKYKKI